MGVGVNANNSPRSFRIKTSQLMGSAEHLRQRCRSMKITRIDRNFSFHRNAGETMDFVRLIAVVGAENCRVGGIENYDDDFMLLEPEAIADEFPDDAYYVVSADVMKSIGVKPLVQGDLLPNQDSVILASPELAPVLAAHFGPTESLAVDVFDPKKKNSKPYFIVRPLQFPDVITTPPEKLKFNPLDDTQLLNRVSELTFDFSSVPDVVNILRAKNLTSDYLARRDFAEDLQKRFKGILIRELSDPIG